MTKAPREKTMADRLPHDERDDALERGPHFSEEPADQEPAWEQVAAGRFMPRRIRGSFRGRALG